jgi:ribonuclease HII
MQATPSQINKLLPQYSFVIAGDENGWGSCAAELIVCAVKAPPSWTLPGLNDSKQLTDNQRYKLRDEILQAVEQGEISYAIASRSNVEIDTLGCFPCLHSAYQEVFTTLTSPDSLHIADGSLKIVPINGNEVYSIVKGDGHFPAIMAASILGKTTRDTHMQELHKEYPQYLWNSNKGYPAQVHKDAMLKYGYTKYHRKSYNPLKDWLKNGTCVPVEQMKLL